MTDSRTDSGADAEEARAAGQGLGVTGAALRELQWALHGERRLEALRRTALLDTPAEEAFDRLSRLATRVLHVPVALVSLVDRDRQFFKSCVGLPPPWCDIRQTPLTYSFCMHVVATGEPLIVEDARQHPVLRDNLAVDQIGVVAYAGIPLTTSRGETLGTFCAIDTRPRVWTDEDVETLEDLAASVMTEIELRATHGLEARALAAEAARVQAEAARQRFALMAELSGVLAEGHEPRALLARAARLLVPEVADGCAFALLDEEGRLEGVAEAHVDAPAGARPRAGCGPPPGLNGSTSRAGHMELGGPEGSCVRVPLLGVDRVLGEATFLTVAPRRFSDLEVRMAGEVARRVGLALDNARLHAESREAIRLRDRFLSIASHELRTPLTALRLQAQLLLRGAGHAGPVPAEQLRAKAHVIARQVERMGHLVDELLDISRMTEGRLVYHLEDVDLAQVVAEVAGRYREDLARAGCTLVLRGGEGHAVGRWDRLRLEQVVTNLLTNALKYGPGRPVTLTVTADADTAWLTVRDEGLGIATEDQARIFERFERAVSEQHYGGFGLGLWIVREIVRGLGGSISVRSMQGAGAAFTVELPRHPPGTPAPLLH